MAMSRSESRKRQNRQRSKRLRKLLVVNTAMLLVIAALIIGYFVQRDGGSDKLNASLNQSNAPAQEEANNNGNAAPTPEDDNTALPDAQADDTNTSPSDNGNAGSGTTNVPADAPSDPPSNDSSDDPSNAPGDVPAGAPNDAPSDTSAEVSNPDTGADEGGNEPSQGSQDDGAVSSGEGEVNLSFAGDVLLAASVEKLMLKNGYDYPYAKVLNFLKAADVMAVNLETPVTLRGTPAPDKQYVYKASPDALPALVNSGIDLVNLANNHTLDQGEEGLLDTIDYLNQVKMPNMGAGRDDTEAFKPVIKEVNGIRIAYIGLTRVVPVGSWKAGKDHPGLAESYDPTRAVAAIKAAKEQADVVVVMVHWGTELMDKPNADQTRLGHAYIDAGADLVIGGHPHVLQGFESYKGKWIAYSMGNFVFSGMPDKRTADTGVLDAKCDAAGKCSLLLHPMRAVQSQPAPLEGDEAAALLKRISGISIHAVIDSNGKVQSKE